MDAPVTNLREWIVENQRLLDQGEAVWLARLAEFDRSGAWADDGQVCCASWLSWRLKMGRSTAHDKLRVAHELAARPVIAAAFEARQLTYSHVRAITRMEDTTTDVDEAMVILATTPGVSIHDVEQVVRNYMNYLDQDVAPPPLQDRHREVRVGRGADGLGRITITMSNLELDEFEAALRAFTDPYFHRRRPPTPADDPSPQDTPTAGNVLGAVDESSTEDSPTIDRSRTATKADAFMDLVSAALSAANNGGAAGDDRYLVHVVKVLGERGATSIDGDLISRGESEAISVRDGGHCRFPGCNRRFVDIHHIKEWDNGGRTDIDNAMNCCRRHHTMIHHQGFRIDGDPNSELKFYRQDDTPIDSTLPALTTRMRMPIAA